MVRIRSHSFSYLGLSLYNKFGSLGAALQYAYPEVRWDLSAFSFRGKKKSVQRWLKLRMTELLPDVEIIEDYQHPELSWGTCVMRLLLRCADVLDGSDRNVELDLWLPEYRIGVEYQGTWVD